MAGTVVVFGATGFTGRMLAEALVRRGQAPVLAGRHDAKVRALAARLGGLQTRRADVSDPASVRALVGKGDVLVTTVGPFQRLGEPALRAAIDAGAHYVDSSGEPAFIRHVFRDCGAEAERAGVLLLPACGYDYVPGNLAGALALQRAGGAAVRVDVGYYVLGRTRRAYSQGTLTSSRLAALHPGMELHDGRLVERFAGLQVREFEVEGRRRAGLSLGGSEHYALPHSFPQLREVNVYLGWFGRRTHALSRGARVFAKVRSLPVVGELVRDVATRMTPESRGQGPDDSTLEGTRAHVIAIAYDAQDRELARVVLEGHNVYRFTADMLAFAAERAAAGDIRGVGARGPVEAFGLDVLERACGAAQLTVAKHSQDRAA